jgi:hypothetical protein
MFPVWQCFRKEGKDAFPGTLRLGEEHMWREMDQGPKALRRHVRHLTYHLNYRPTAAYYAAYHFLTAFPLIRGHGRFKSY